MPSVASTIPAFSSFEKILARNVGDTPCNSARSRALGRCSRGLAIHNRQWRAYSTPVPMYDTTQTLLVLVRGCKAPGGADYANSTSRMLPCRSDTRTWRPRLAATSTDFRFGWHPGLLTPGLSRDRLSMTQGSSRQEDPDDPRRSLGQPHIPLPTRGTGALADEGGANAP